MKTSLKFLLLLMAFVLVRCSEERIEPAQLDEDPSTRMQSNDPQGVFTIDVTTIPGWEENGMPELTEFRFSSDDGAKVSVNWGDGTIEKVTLDASPRYMNHQYSRTKNYSIRITGEISRITSFGIWYQHLIIRNINLTGLVNLLGASMGLNYKEPSVVNFSHNRKIQIIVFAGMDELTDIIIPSINQLTTVVISGPNSLSTAVVDRIVSRVYTSVQSSPRVGYFDLYAVWYDASTEMVGPPSSYSITKLKKLRDVYGWEIAPDLEEFTAVK